MVLKRRLVVLAGILSLLLMPGLAHAFVYLKDAYPAQGTSGNLTIEICSNTPFPAAQGDSTNFTFYVNDQRKVITSMNFSQCGAGPFGNNASDVLQLLNSSTCLVNPPTLPGAPFVSCAKFALNVSWSDAQTALDVKAHDNDSIAISVTLNYLNFRVNTPNTIIMLQNASSKTYLASGPALTDANGYYMEHCQGDLTGTECRSPATGCVVHGIPFPNVGNSCSNGTGKVIFFDFISSNSTNSTLNLSNASFVFYNLTSPISIAMLQAFPFFGQPGENPVQPTVSLAQIFSFPAGDLLFSLPTSGGPDGGGNPGFITPNQQYTIRLNGSLNTTLFDYNFSFIPTSSGMAGAIVSIKAATEFTTFIGKVINQSGGTVNASTVVYAQPLFGFTPPMGTNLVNSSFTDANGIFRIRVPKNLPYKFLLASGQTNPATGSLIYNPTIDTNNGRGYFAQQDTIILPPSTIQSGGTVNVNVLLNGATGVQGEISRVVNYPAGAARDAFSSRMSPLKLFETVDLPTSLFLPLVAPINSVLLNIYGINISGGGGGGPPAITHVCFNTTTVTQGQISSITCTLNNTPGTLNLIVNECRDSVFTCSMAQQAFNIWFDSRILISGPNGIVADIEEGSMAQEGSFNNPGQVQIKLPVGAYNLSVIPKFPFNAPLGVHYNGSFVINPSQMTNVTIRRQSPGWQMQPWMPFQMRSTSNNPVAVAVYDFGANPPAILNNTRIRVNIQALQLNGSYAGNMSSVLQMTFYSDIKVPGPIASPGGFNVSFRPADFSIPAGKYLMLFNASTDFLDNQTQFSLLKFPFTVSDFDIGMDLAKFSWATSETMQGKIFAFLNNGTGLSGNATISFYDFAGTKVGASSTVVVTDGEGAISIPVSSFTSQIGFYEMLVVMNASGSFGFANNFLQITNFIITTDFDRRDYKPTDNVLLTVGVSNSTGAAVSGATIEGLVDSYQNATYGLTDSGGKATLTFVPGSITGGNWTFGFHSLRLKIAYSSATEVIQQETFTGFFVKGFDVQIQTDKPNYQPADNVTLNIFFGGQPDQPDLFVDDVQTQPVEIQQTQFGFRVVIAPPIGGWTPGRHLIKFSFSQGGNTQSVFTGFDVNILSILAAPNKFSYQVGEFALITTKIINGTNSSPIFNATVNATLYKFQQNGDLTINSSLNYTDATGVATHRFNLTKTGFHYVKLLVSNQAQYVGFLVSGMIVSLTTNKQGYSPGDTLNLTINVSGANAVGASVSARLFAFGSSTDLPTSGITFVGTGPYFASTTYIIPSSAPAITYFLDVKVTTTTGEIGFGSIPIVVSGGQKLSIIADRPFTQPYKTGEAGTFTATLVNGTGSAVNGSNITFEMGSATGTPKVVGSALTDTSGKAILTVSGGSMPSSDGAYFMHAYLTTTPTVQAYTGFSVSSLKVELGVGSGKQFTLGQNITFSVNVTNATSGAAITPTSGSIIIWDKNRGQISFPMTISGAQPYTLTQAIPTDASAIGTYTVIALMSLNSSVGSDSLLISVQNQSTPVNITLPSAMNASVPFNVNISVSGVASPVSASLRVFSPSATNVSFINNTINLTGGSVNVSVNISTPGKYVFFADVNGYGTASAVGEVVTSTGASAYRVWTTSDLAGTNATTFSAGATVYIWSSAQNTTAVIMFQNSTTNATSSYSLPVVQQSGNYYTTFSSTASSQTYFVRLDALTATGVAVTMFRTT